MFEGILDLQFAVVAVILTTALGVLFLFKYPAANCILGFSVVGLSGVQIYGSFNSGRLLVALQMLTVAKCLWDAARLGKTGTIGWLLRTGTSLYAILLVVYWIKIIHDCFYYGFDIHRTSALKGSVTRVLLPWVTVFLSLAVHGTVRTRNGLILGTAAFACAYVFPLFYPMIVEGRLIAAITGASRLTTYTSDSINGGRMFFIGCIGFLCAAVVMRHRVSLRSLFLGVALGFFVLVLLNGTRQFLLATLGCFVGTLFLLGRSRQLIGLAFLAGVGLGVYNLAGLFTEVQVFERVGEESLKIEATTSRGAIWLDALSTARGYPLAGVGFRNYGEEVETVMATGDVVLYRDTAHGFLQEAVVEHGFVIGGGLFLSWLWLVGRCWRARVEEASGALLLLLVILCVPECFTCGSLCSFGFHMVALTSYVLALMNESDRLGESGFQPSEESGAEMAGSLRPAEGEPA